MHRRPFEGRHLVRLEVLHLQQEFEEEAVAEEEYIVEEWEVWAKPPSVPQQFVSVAPLVHLTSPSLTAAQHQFLRKGRDAEVSSSFFFFFFLFLKLFKNAIRGISLSDSLHWEKICLKIRFFLFFYVNSQAGTLRLVPDFFFFYFFFLFKNAIRGIILSDSLHLGKVCLKIRFFFMSILRQGR